MGRVRGSREVAGRAPGWKGARAPRLLTHRCARPGWRARPSHCRAPCLAPQEGPGVLRLVKPRPVQAWHSLSRVTSTVYGTSSRGPAARPDGALIRINPAGGARALGRAVAPRLGPEGWGSLPRWWGHPSVYPFPCLLREQLPDSKREDAGDAFLQKV